MTFLHFRPYNDFHLVHLEDVRGYLTESVDT